MSCHLTANGPWFGLLGQSRKGDQLSFPCTLGCVCAPQMDAVLPQHREPAPTNRGLLSTFGRPVHHTALHIMVLQPFGFPLNSVLDFHPRGGTLF